MSTAHPPAAPEWEGWDDERLLDLRMCDLGLRIRGSFVEPFLRQVRRELRQRGLRMKPHFWLSDEWFCPDGISGVAIPFYLAHPRLARLEQAQMLEVEGGTPDWCLRILRHEVGHAIENAYGLRRRKRRIQLFGRSSEKYPEDYAPRPYSKSFVVHLEAGYAQSHPDEDFAETFAVWLTPGSDWARRYAGWKALRKLEYVDALMREIAGKEPRRRGAGRSSRCARCRRRCASTTSSGGSPTGWGSSSCTTATCAGSSPTRPSTPRPPPRRASCRACARRPAAACAASRGATSTSSTVCSAR